MASLTPAADRIRGKIERRDDSGCWIFTGSRDRLGYGRIGVARSDGRWVPRLVHRVMYEAERGPIPAGLTLDHLCRVPSCCNPAHLEAVPMGVNVLRGYGPPARHARQTHCKRGHPLSGDNLSPASIRQGRRRCRICVNATSRASWHRNHAKEAEF